MKKKTEQITGKLIPLMAQRGLDHISEIRRLEAEIGNIVRRSMRFVDDQTCWNCKHRKYKPSQVSRCRYTGDCVNKISVCAVWEAK